MLANVRADLARYPGGGLHRVGLALRAPGFYALVLHRAGFCIYKSWPRGLALPAKVVYRVLAALAGWATGIYLSADARIGPGLYIGHWGGIRVGAGVSIGACCNLSPMVILGFGVHRGRAGVPALGDRVYVGAGAKIIGPVLVGDDVAIGANAVVCRDVPCHVSVGGVPARVISAQGSAAYLAVGQSYVPATLAQPRPRNVAVVSPDERSSPPPN